MNNVDVFIVAGGKCGSSTLRKTFLNQNMFTIKSHNPKCFKNQFGYDGFFPLQYWFAIVLCTP